MTKEELEKENQELKARLQMLESSLTDTIDKLTVVEGSIVRIYERFERMEREAHGFTGRT